MHAHKFMALSMLLVIAGCESSGQRFEDVRNLPAADPVDILNGSSKTGASIAYSGAPSHAATSELYQFDRLVGRWRITGEADGEVEYKWMEGGHFLVQQVDFQRPRGRIKGVEIIRYLRPFGGERSRDIKSRWYDDEGNTLDYVYEIQADTLTIWGGERGSPAHYTGRFSDDGNTLSGGWVYPGGGGYSTTATKIR